MHNIGVRNADIVSFHQRARNHNTNVSTSSAMTEGIKKTINTKRTMCRLDTWPSVREPQQTTDMIGVEVQYKRENGLSSQTTKSQREYYTW